MTTAKNRFPNLTADINAARDEARKAIEDMDDRGTCNFDSLLFPVGKSCVLKRKTAAFEAALTAAGLNPSYRNYGLNRGYVVSVRLGGQAATRTKATEVVCDMLRAKGYDVTMYYQMD